MRRNIIGLQGLYYLITGVWPLVSMESFVLVTGPKTDEWLVYMVGMLAASIGLALLTAAYFFRDAGAPTVLAAGTAISFAAIDTRYALSGRIAQVYLLDAAVEIGFLVALLVSGLRASQSPTKRNG